ncbi:aromatic amino acid ammonia-lyase [Pedomonas mirosovicensis]|uniref:aromatic amino acid ammonia-lyase n=1 Tax=Pedomonas mirosovicensis TaxID=2908641 RepID=UPI002167CE65|nr:aromatic amino acid ammonia-lyase [Pedomonas mirosovicensis]
MYRPDHISSPLDGAAAQTPIVFGDGPLRIEDVNAIARRSVPVALSASDAFRRKVEAGVAFLDTLLDREGHVYGVTTGYGDSCGRGVPRDLVEALPLHLSRFHGCGLGRHLDAAQTRAVLAVRLASLARGVSGVRWVLLERLSDFLNHDLLPLIPEEGSVGASGDLTPLSYIAAALVGERDVLYRGKTCPAAEALAAAGLVPLTLQPKEGLAIMNGTAVMTALACDAYARAEYLTRLTARLTAMASVALGGNEYHFDPRLFAVKPHPGQAEIAAWIRADLGARGRTHP